MIHKLILAILMFAPMFAFANPASVASETPGGIQPQVMPQVVPPKPAAPPAVAPKPSGAPVPAALPRPQFADEGPHREGSGDSSGGSQVLQQVLQSLQGPLNQMLGGSPPDVIDRMMSQVSTGGDAPPAANTDWSTYSYPDTYNFGYGGQGAGNIGNGLCTARNSERTQVTQGYCAILSNLLTTEGTCANEAMKEILQAAGPDGSGIGQLNTFCPTYGKLTDNTQRTLVFQQILATLITQESGWNPNAQERPWRRSDGAMMGGKGLFQIGVHDSAKGGDCAAVDSVTIFDPRTNMKCGACIALKGLAKDKTIGRGSGDSGARGMATYFGPLRDAQARKRDAMAAAVAEYCRASTGDGGSAQDFEAVTGGSGTTQ